MIVGLSLRRGALFALAALCSTCGGSSPTGGTPPTTLPAPKPTPTPPAAQTLCQRLGYVSTPNTKCAQQAPEFQGAVEDAISKVMHAHPEYFTAGRLGPLVTNFGGYYVGVLNALDAAGYCAGFDGEEVQVKESNEFNEQYKISTSAGYVRHDSYQSTCRPAAFPTPGPADIPPPPGCTLPPSHEVACGPASPSYLPDVKAAIDEVVQEHPELFDFNDVVAHTTDGYKVLNIQQYFIDVIANLQKRGFCARFDGEEVVVKTSNTYSDHYDILTGENYIRRGDGEYQVSCYPAAF